MRGRGGEKESAGPGRVLAKTSRGTGGGKKLRNSEEAHNRGLGNCNAKAS
jgi:hypothetical protein